MQVFRLLAARRPRRLVSTITAAPAPGNDSEGDDEGPFFDLDVSVRASTSDCPSGSESDDSSSCTELDFVISLQRSRSASPSYESLFFGGAAPVKFCQSEPSKASARCHRRGKLRALSFGSKNVALYGRRSSRLLAAAYGYGYRYGHGSPAKDDEEEEEARRTPSGDVIRRYLTKISRRLRRRGGGPVSAGETKPFRLRKSRSASAARAPPPPPPARRDDSLLEKQDGIASAIAHCKESLHRASVSECDLSLARSRSDPSKREAP